MKVYAYLRYSTNKQDEFEEEVIINRYCESHNLHIDETVVDRAVCSVVDWESKENLSDLISRLDPGDVVLCSEASRLSRSMVDFSKLLNEGFRRLQARLIICNVGMDIDCSKLNAMTEIQLQMLIFAAQFEREMIINRTNAALEHRKHLAETQGGWVSRSGNWCTKLGPQNQYTSRKGGLRNAKRRKEESLNVDPEVLKTIKEMRNDSMSYDQICNVLNNSGFKTASGRRFFPMTVKRMITAYEEREEM